MHWSLQQVYAMHRRPVGPQSYGRSTVAWLQRAPVQHGKTFHQPVHMGNDAALSLGAYAAENFNFWATNTKLRARNSVLGASERISLCNGSRRLASATYSVLARTNCIT